MVAQSAGYARGQVTEERIIPGENGTHRLEIAFRAEVCVPREPRQMPLAVSLGPVLNSRGEEQPRLRDAVEQAFSTSRRFVLMSPGDPAELSDLRLEARILRLDVTPIASPPQASGQVAQRITLAAVLTVTRQEDGAVFTQSVEDYRNIGGAQDARQASEQFVLQQLSTAVTSLQNQVLRQETGATSATPVTPRGIQW
jgi:membrane-associated protease RseP (regulator of RpoE activity)